MTIMSVLSQTYKYWEMIIIDDCSTDNSYDIALSYAANDRRVKVYRMEKNSGTALCRNKAIEISTGEYLAFLDSDDLWMPEKLERQLKFMRENNCDFSFTEYEHIDEHGNRLGVKAKTVAKLTYQKMLFHDFCGCLTVMYKQDAQNKIFIPKVGNGIEDYTLFLQLLKSSRNAMGYAICLAKYRIHTKSLSGSKLGKLRKTKFYFDIMMHIERQNFFFAFFYLLTNQFIKYFWKYKKFNNDRIFIKEQCSINISNSIEKKELRG
jgi:glycosyltransferase involved in cell wall biosynthesis